VTLARQIARQILAKVYAPEKYSAKVYTRNVKDNERNQRMLDFARWLGEKAATKENPRNIYGDPWKTGVTSA
jgi:hypothetical protein